MLKNFRAYRIHSDWPDSENELATALAQVAFKPCNAFSERSLGFEPPVETEESAYARRLSGADLMQLRFQSRVLPVAVVKEALGERVADFKTRTLRDPSRKEKRELKEEVYGELLPKALLRSDRIRGFYLREPSILVVATPTAKIAEQFLTSLREALGSVQATPLAFKKPVRTLLHDVFLGKSKQQFQLGRECRMKDPTEKGSTVSWLDMDLADASVRKHVSDGLVLDRLGLSFDSIARLVLDEEVVVRKLRFAGLDALDELEDDDPLLRHDAEFTIEVGFVTRFVAALQQTLGGYA
ncbi:MAG: recombination-associated protein RdgC [Pseudomonadales bacterium]